MAPFPNSSRCALHVKRLCWKMFALALVLTALVIPGGHVLADVAPPANPPGSNLEPGSESTQVRMLAETVLIEVLPDYAPRSLGQARIKADFTMRNLGGEPETMAARFPISAHDGRSGLVEVQELTIKVDGNQVSYRRIAGEDPHQLADEATWAEFDVTFPPSEEVEITVSYVLNGTGYFPFVGYEYILSTGAGWKDSIGSADIILRLPYDVNRQNFLAFFSAGTGGFDETPPTYTLNGKEVRWHFDNLEPTSDDNLDFSIVAPAAWQKVLIEQGNTAQNPNDGEAWGRLGKAYKEISFLPKELRPDPGGQEVFDLSQQAYQRCLVLLPDDSLWHAGYAELLYNYYSLKLRWNDPYNPLIYQLMAELDRALELDPTNQLAQELAQYLSWDLPEGVIKSENGYIFLYLTATPTLQTQPEPATVTPEPTATSEPVPPATLSSPPTEIPEPLSKPALPFCGAATLALPVAGIALKKRFWGSILDKRR